MRSDLYNSMVREAAALSLGLFIGSAQKAIHWKPNERIRRIAIASISFECWDAVMHTSPVRYKDNLIVPFASVANRGYAARVFISDPAGKSRGFTVLGYFASEMTACSFALSYAKAHIDGRRPLKPPFACCHNWMRVASPSFLEPIFCDAEYSAAGGAFPV